MKKKQSEVLTLHEPVLVHELMCHIREKRNGIIVDGTCGSGGHAQHILDELEGNCLLICLDQDEEALLRTRKRLNQYHDSVIIKKSNFALLDTVLDELGINAIDACILDLGISSDQLADSKRGFSFRNVGPLDMRMDTNTSLTARDIIQSYSEDDLIHLLKEYGEEYNARRIVRALIKWRSNHEINTTAELAQFIERVYPKRRSYRIHPATKTFQALRIAVNNELEQLKTVLEKIPRYLAPNGLMCVISFHSLEDRIVKHTFRMWAQQELVTVITKKPLQPRAEETEKNNRARSAKLRIAKRSLHE